MKQFSPAKRAAAAAKFQHLICEGRHAACIALLSPVEKPLISEEYSEHTGSKAPPLAQATSAHNTHAAASLRNAVISAAISAGVMLLALMNEPRGAMSSMFGAPTYTGTQPGQSREPTGDDRGARANAAAAGHGRIIYTGE